MGLDKGLDDRSTGPRLPELMTRLEAINRALEEYCATALKLERARAAAIDDRTRVTKGSS
jgi:hypothetical protein